MTSLRITTPALSGRTQVILALIWVTLTLPWTFCGYGSDVDAWMTATAAEKIWNEGAYFSSRTTGFPLFEILHTPLIHFGGAFLSNLLVLLEGLICLAAVFRLSQLKVLNSPLPYALVTVFLPIFVVNASSTMDYVGGLAFFWWSLVFLIAGQERRSAVLIGLSCGFRVSNILLAGPFLVYLWSERSGRSRSLSFVLITVIVSGLAYSPYLLTAGLPASPQRDLDPALHLLMAGYNFLGLYGVLPTVAIAFFSMAALRSRRGPNFSREPSLTKLHLVNLLVWTGAFVLLPFESEYLFPIIPSVAHLLDRTLATRHFWLLAIVLLSRHLFTLELAGGESGNRVPAPRVEAGFLQRDLSHRRFMLSVRRLAGKSQLKRPAILMFGANWIPAKNADWIYLPDEQLWKQRDGNLHLSLPVLDPGRLAQLRSQGFRLLVWRGQQEEYLRLDEVDWREFVTIVDDLAEIFGEPVSGTPRL